jgi:hypothetical protein
LVAAKTRQRDLGCSGRKRRTFAALALTTPSLAKRIPITVGTTYALEQKPLDVAKESI